MTYLQTKNTNTNTNENSGNLGFERGTLSALVDGRPAVAVVNLSVACSVLNKSRVGRLFPGSPYRRREVTIQNVPDDYRRVSLGLIVRDLTEDVDLLLGKDWYTACLQQRSALCTSQLSLSYIDRLFNATLETCVLTQNAEAVRNAAMAHGITLTSRSALECQRVLVQHLLTGECVEAGSDGCREICLHVRYGDRQTIVADIVSRLKLQSAVALPRESLLTICSALKIPFSEKDSRVSLVIALADYTELFQKAEQTRATDIAAVEDMGLSDLRQVAYAHGVPYRNISWDDLKSGIYRHLVNGECAQYLWDSDRQDDSPLAYGCVGIQSVHASMKASSKSGMDPNKVKITLLRTCAASFSARAIRRLLPILGVTVPPDATLVDLRKVLKKHIGTLVRGKSAESAGIPGSHEEAESGVIQKAPAKRQRRPRRSTTDMAQSEEDETPADIWPRVATSALKKRVLKLFRRATGRDALATFVCAVCAEQTKIMGDRRILSSTKLDLQLLRPGDEDLTAPRMNRGSASGSNALEGLCLDSRGVVNDPEGGPPNLEMCPACYGALTARRPRLPALALANDMDVGALPEELRSLTPVEESMIALCRAKCWILQLREESEGPSPAAQRGIRGHAMIFPQRPEKLTAVLPPTVDEVMTYICVVFVGSSRPSEQWIRDKAKPLLVRREKVRNALQWLKMNNPLYKDVTISTERIEALPKDSVLPFPIEYQELSTRIETTTSGYDPTLRAHAPSFTESVGDNSIFSSIVVADVDGESSASALSAAALRHLTTVGKGFLELPHGNDPVNEFYNPGLFPMTYPTLFPYGRGGFEDRTRKIAVSMERHIGHLLRLEDRRFQEHPSFMFVAFNILQRRQALRQTRFKVNAPRFQKVAERIATVSMEAIQAVTDRIYHGGSASASNEDERVVLQLMNEVRMVTRQVSGSAAARTAMRNEIRGLMLTCGMPSYFVTINPADVHHPLVKFLAGADIDIDKLLPEQVPKYWDQAILVARNPVIGATFFNLYMKAFIQSILGFGCKDSEIARLGGVLGKVKAYYGCVEAQGRGSLHCHMLVWIDGALNPNEIRDKIKSDPHGSFAQDLVRMLDDNISTCVPFKVEGTALEDPPHHPCAIRGISTDDPEYDHKRKGDLYHLIKKCQSHSHRAVCWKYCKKGEPKTCRFDLGENGLRPLTTVDPVTGEIQLRCLEGLINNFNETIIEAIRCNMDIKFIGSGKSAKAVLYYITDYITKTQLKAHVAFAALELAVKRLGQPSLIVEDDVTVQAKRLLQKCAYAMISHQELSGQQVASYIMGYEDRFTSHKYRCLWWMSFEGALTKMGGALKGAPSLEPSATNSVAPEISGMNESNSDDGEYLDDTAAFAYRSEDVTIEQEGDILLPKSGAVADYLLRGTAYNDFCVWDFISKTRKVRSLKGRNSSGTKDDSGRAMTDAEDTQSSDDDDDTHMKGVESGHKLLVGHLECETHYLQKLGKAGWMVPVPIGPSLPRPDDPETQERYYRLMMILFKPWRVASDLKRGDETWQDAFAEFTHPGPPVPMRIMRNMQMLQECRDARDHHYSQTYGKDAPAPGDVPDEWVDEAHRGTENDEMYTADTTESILAHLQSISEAQSVASLKGTQAADLCVSAAEDAGLFHRPSFDGSIGSAEKRFDNEIELNDLCGHEMEWRNAYEENRQTRKRIAMELAGVEPFGAHDVQADNTPVVRQLQEPMNDQINESVPYVREVPMDSLASQAEFPSGRIVDIEHEFTLNTEQALAFRIICEAAQAPKGNPLRMYIGGSGGTGKSRVINAVKAYFARRGQARRLRLTSYTGVAAHNVAGMTLHAALNLMNASRKVVGAKTQKELRAMWEGVDFLFIDEVSMIGCKTLLQVHNALTIAKGCTEPFGGVNIVFAGDFAQLSPVGEMRLFTNLQTKSTPSSGVQTGQDYTMGKLLWLLVTEVVILRKQMRQAGSANEPFVQLLERLRVGKCTEDDYRTLNTRLARRVRADCSSGWAGVPIIVAENSPKDALNEKAAQAYAEATCTPLSWYYAADFSKGHQIVDRESADAIKRFHSGQTSQRPYRIPLAKGMPVILAQNYDVESGVVNGTFGRLKSVRYTVSDVAGEKRRRARSCVIESEAYSGEQLPHLGPDEFVALEDQVSVRVTDPYSHDHLEFRRHSVPVVPAFAMTVYKAQGLTFPKVVVDLQGCRNLEAAYVMCSRVKSLDGLLILRDFERKKITTNPSEETRDEFKRLELLNLYTIAKHSTDTATQKRVEEQIVVLKATMSKLSMYLAPDDVLHQFGEQSKRMGLIDREALHKAPGSKRPAVDEVRALSPKRRRID